MDTKADIIISLAQASPLFGVNIRTLRAWVEHGRLVAVRRAGRGGGGGEMFFYRGAIAELVFAMCPVCAQGFKRKTLSAKFCSQRCRQRYARRKA